MIRRLFITLISLVALLLPLVPASASAFDIFGQTCSGSASQSALCQGRGDSSQDPLTGRNGLIRGIANVLAFVTGLGALITIIVGGFRYITANGDANKAKGARDAIVAAVVGLLIVALAESILAIVLGRI